MMLASETLLLLGQFPTRAQSEKLETFVVQTQGTAAGGQR